LVALSIACAHPIEVVIRGIMYQDQFERMSMDQLWELHGMVNAILAERLIAKKGELETRLKQLRSESAAAGSSSPRRISE